MLYPVIFIWRPLLGPPTQTSATTVAVARGRRAECYHSPFLPSRRRGIAPLVGAHAPVRRGPRLTLASTDAATVRRPWLPCAVAAAALAEQARSAPTAWLGWLVGLFVRVRSVTAKWHSLGVHLLHTGTLSAWQPVLQQLSSSASEHKRRPCALHSATASSCVARRGSAHVRGCLARLK